MGVLDGHNLFQSTLSMRRATYADYAIRNKFRDISIHALHEESDERFVTQDVRHLQFQSTLSMRRATPQGGAVSQEIPISIHALHEESDVGFGRGDNQRYDFNPRSP